MRFRLILTLLLALPALSMAKAQAVRSGADIGPGTVVAFPASRTVAGEEIRPGVPTVLIFAKIRGCPLCEAVGHIAGSWLERYPGLQIAVVETGTALAAVEQWSEETGVPTTADSDGQLAAAFDTNVTLVYVLDEAGTVRDKVRPLYRSQWNALDRQLERASRGDWDAVTTNSRSLPAVGGTARSAPAVPLGTGSPVLVLIGDGYCTTCRELATRSLARGLERLAEEVPELNVYLLEPDVTSIAEGFYGTPTYDYGPDSTFETFVSLFGAEAAGTEIMRYLESGRRVYPLPDPVWPEEGLPAGVSVISYALDSDDDPVRAWGYGEKELGMLVFDGAGRYLGPTPHFRGSTGTDLADSVTSLLQTGAGD